jgi:hypothetical protein
MKLTKVALISSMSATLLTMAPLAHADKKEWVQKLLATQQTSLENTARDLTERPARQLVAAAQPVLAQGVPADKREATAKLVDVEIKKYIDAAFPAVRASTLKLSQTVMAPIFEDKFTEDELKQLVSMLDSPVLKKYQGLLPEVGNALLEKVLIDARPQVDPSLQAAQSNIRAILDKATGGKLSGNAQGPGPAAAPAKSGKPVSK